MSTIGLSPEVPEDAASVSSGVDYMTYCDPEEHEMNEETSVNPTPKKQKGVNVFCREGLKKTLAQVLY